jgi:hypothetical protein
MVIGIHETELQVAYRTAVEGRRLHVPGSAETCRVRAGHVRRLVAEVLQAPSRRVTGALERD